MIKSDGDFTPVTTRKDSKIVTCKKLLVTQRYKKKYKNIHQQGGKTPSKIQQDRKSEGKNTGTNEVMQ